MDLTTWISTVMGPPTKAVAASLLAVALATGSTDAAEKFAAVVVFGDSLSDNGNAGRYSNGPVWVEELGTRLGLRVEPSDGGGWNFAVGGARLDPNSGPTSLAAQADRYLARARPDGRVLHVAFGGGNDVLGAVALPGAERMVDQAAAALKSILDDLAEHGATDILVPTLPDVGMTPAMRSRGARAAAEARALTDRFNAAVDRAVQDVDGRHTVRFHRLDVHAMAERARHDPSAFGFVDVASPCQALTSCEGYLFWDDVHPTAPAHRRLAEAAFELVSNSGSEETGAP